MIAQNQKGVSLIVTTFIMIIILSAALFISILLYSEAKIVKNTGNSVSAFFAADSGVEKVLYYDRQVLPTQDTATACPNGDECSEGQVCGSGGYCQVQGVRGMCTTYYTPGGWDNPNVCQDSGTPDPLACNPIYAPHPTGLGGCDPDKCDKCDISFSDAFDGRTYSVFARVYYAADNNIVLEVQSAGVYGGAQRKVEVSVASTHSADAVVVDAACAVPISTPQGAEIDIRARVTASNLGDTIKDVFAIIQDEQGDYYNEFGDSTGSTETHIPLSLFEGGYDSGIWRYCNAPRHADGSSCTAWNWQTSSSAPITTYTVYILAVDNILPTPNTKLEQIFSYSQCP